MKWFHCTLVFVFLLFHGSVLLFERGLYKSQAAGKNFEDPTLQMGDETYYRNGMLSLVEHPFEERVSIFKSPEMSAPNRIPAGTFSKFESFYAGLYPYPPYKAGFSWTGALLSGIVPKAFFQNVVPRVPFVNLLLSLGCGILIFVLVLQWTQSVPCAFFACFLHLTDVAVLHTNYHSMSHTTAGLFWFLLSLFFFRKNQPFVLGLAMGLSVQTSPHLLAWVVALVVVLCFKFPRKHLFWTFCGFLVPLLYLLSVDLILELPRRSIQGYLSSLLFAGTKDTALWSVPLKYKWMWDLRGIQPFIVYLLLVTGTFLFLYRRKIGEVVRNWHNQELTLLALLLFIGGGVSFFSSLPIIRTLVPFMTLFVVFWGISLGTLWQIGSVPVRAALVLLVFLWAGSTIYTFDWIEKPLGKPRNAQVYLLNDDQAMQEKQRRYGDYLRSGNLQAPVFEQTNRYSTKSLRELIETIDASPLPKENLYLEWHPTSMVTAYAATHRFYSSFINRPWHGIQASEIFNDFKLYGEIMTYKEQLQKTEGAWLEYKRAFWHLGNWDHETGYWLIFKNGFQNFVKGTSLEKVDLRNVYYFKYSELKSLLESSEKNL